MEAKSIKRDYFGLRDFALRVSLWGIELGFLSLRPGFSTLQS